MATLDTLLQIRKSGGSSNTDQNLSLGGTINTTDGGLFVSNYLHNMFDETQKDESLTGDTEYRHFYFYNNKPYTLKNCKLQILSNTKEKWSKVYFAKGTAADSFAEQAVPNEDTGPVGISDNDWISSGTLDLGNVEWTASIWTRRVVLPGSLIVGNEKVSFRVMGDTPGGVAPPTCPTGQHWSVTASECVNDSVATCPEGQHMVEGVCVPVTCPTGYHLSGGQCVPDDGGQGGGGNMPLVVKAVVVSDTECGSDSYNVIDFIGALDRDVVLHCGDFSHETDVSCMFDAMASAGLAAIIKPSPGNHDSDEDGSDDTYREIMSEYGLPSVGYYSFTIQNIHFVCINSQADYDEGSTQWNWIRADLQAASTAASIDWIICYAHKPMYCAPNDGHPADTAFRDAFGPMFDEFHVDIVCNGHIHSLQRTYPIRYNAASPGSPTILSTSATDVFTDIDGRIFCSCSAGGRSHYSINSVPAYEAYTNDSDWGILFLETANTATNRGLMCNFVLAESGTTVEILDAWRLNKTV